MTMKCVVWFSLQRFSKNFLVLNKIGRIIIINLHMS